MRERCFRFDWFFRVTNRVDTGIVSKLSLQLFYQRMLRYILLQRSGNTRCQLSFGWYPCTRGFRSFLLNVIIVKPYLSLTKFAIEPLKVDLLFWYKIPIASLFVHDADRFVFQKPLVSASVSKLIDDRHVDALLTVLETLFTSFTLMQEQRKALIRLFLLRHDAQYEICKITWQKKRPNRW